MSKKYLVLLLLLVAVAAVAATIYKWVDEQGVTHYSQTPPPDQKAQEIQTLPSLPAEGAGVGQPPLKTWQEQEREFQKRRIQRQDAERREEEAQAKARSEARARKELCISARQNLHTLQLKVPVYQLDEYGERKYLDDKARAAEIEKMKELIERDCQPE